MTESNNTTDNLARTIAIIGLLIGFATGLYQIIEFYSNKSKDDKITNIEINQLVNEAYDQLGGGLEDALTVELKKPSTYANYHQYSMKT